MKENYINVLIACEESQAECVAFRNLGFNAFSCDIQPSRFNSHWHILGDVTPFLKGRVQFTTESGDVTWVTKWHLIIAHPPCTYITRAGACRMYHKVNGVVQLDSLRFSKMKDAVRFFYACMNAQADFVAVENPVPLSIAGLPRPSCWIHPSWFGVKYTKKTLFWLRGLPPLMPSIIFPNPKSYVACSSGKYRSRTFPQVAQAIAQQWGGFILDFYNNNRLTQRVTF